MGRERRKWTPAEDALLRNAVSAAIAESRPLLWRELAKAIPGRSNKDCRRRWWNSLADGTVKGLWSEEEDIKLIEAVKGLGTNWRVVAQHVGSRTPDQCSSHWTQVLDPDINHCDWESTEDDQLLHEVLEHGTNWTTISNSHVPRRTTLALKNRYATLRLKDAKKRKRRTSREDLSPARSSPSERSKSESVASPSTRATSPSCDCEGQGEECSEHSMDGSNVSLVTEEEIEGLISPVSTRESMEPVQMELGSDWSGFLDASSAFCHSALTDALVYPSLGKNEMGMPGYDQVQFPAIEPSLSFGTDADAFSLVHDPWALYSEPIDTYFGCRSNVLHTVRPTRIQTGLSPHSVQADEVAHASLGPYQLSLEQMWRMHSTKQKVAFH